MSVAEGRERVHVDVVELAADVVDGDAHHEHAHQHVEQDAQLDDEGQLASQCLTQEMPFVVDLGILLDLLVGVFVMGIAIHHIRREFDDIDTAALTTLTD